MPSNSTNVVVALFSFLFRTWNVTANVEIAYKYLVTIRFSNYIKRESGKIFGSRRSTNTNEFHYCHQFYM